VPGEQRTRAWRGRQVALFGLVLLAVAIGGCGGGESPPSGAQPTAAGPGRPAPPPELATFCGAAVDLVQVLDDGVDVNPDSTPEDTAKAYQDFQAAVEPSLTAVEQNTPPAVQQDIGTLGRQARYAVSTSTDAPLNTPEFDAALDRTRTVVTSQCLIPEVRVTSTDFKYDGIPPEVTPGAVAVTFGNLGAEPHEMEVFRIDDSEQRPVTDLVALPDAERGLVLTAVATSINADPGEIDRKFLKLVPGRYGVACLVPQGSTDAVRGTGPAHATLGEVGEFTVR
jgi:hypothetical protein